MALPLDILLTIIGIALLAAGGEALVRGALKIAEKLGVSPLLAGLVIVGFGTSMPELVVSLGAARAGEAEIAVANVVGSNIGNLLFILGVCALIRPMAVTPVALRRDASVMVGAAAAFIGVAWDGVLERWEGAALLVALFAYLAWSYRQDQRSGGPPAEVHAAEAEQVRPVSSSLYAAVAVVLGLALLIAGATILIEGAKGIATALGASEAAIGLTVVALTVVALGTSLPELTVSVMAAFRGKGDVAIGNVLGSNTFNALGILGVAALVQPLVVGGRIAAVDQWVMVGVSLLAVLFLLTGRRLGRVEGGVLIAGYVVYIAAGFSLG